jgi:thiol:disulfide interchange protein
MLSKWLTILLLIVSLSAGADPLTSASLVNKTSSSFSAGISATDDFLPVFEAYPLKVQVQPNHILLNWHIADGYYLYGDQFRFSLLRDGKPLAMEITREQGEIAYDDYFEKEVEQFRFFTTQSLSLPADTSGELTLSAGFQGCADAGLCYPPETLHYRIDLAAGTATPVDTASTSLPVHTEKPASFIVMFVFALLGGLILNLMPCVFPVLSIKLLSVARSNQSNSHLREHSWFYTLGVLTTFLLTAILLILLRNSGAAIGWGYQLQSPLFIGLLAILFLVLGLSMSGFITIGTRWMGVGEQLTAGNSYHNSFFTGVLAVIVASPCSVPFMGVALGYALTQPTVASLVIFAGLGLGLASPFLVFAYVPWLIKHLPKPGPWMEKLKHWLALPLYLSAIWLLWVLFHQTIGLESASSRHANQYWENYSAQKLENYLAADEAVFVELTADWCITCLVNEKVALTRPAVLNSMKENNIRYLRGDWTNRDPVITALLTQHQRGGVPLYLFYDKEKNLTILPQLLTEQTVLNVIR